MDDAVRSYRCLLLRGFMKSKPTSSLLNVVDDSFIGFEECFELSNASLKAISCLHLDNVVIEASRTIQTRPYESSSPPLI